MLERVRAASPKHQVCTCEHCGQGFSRAVRGRDARRYCSRECGVAAIRLLSEPQRAAREAKMLARRDATEARKVEQHCMHCGVSVGRHLAPRYCSSSCRWEAYKTRRPDVLDVIRGRQRQRYATNPHTRNVAKQQAHRRRTRLVEAFVEDVDFIAVYARDGGVCQLCREPVDPMAGKHHPRSPSYDHIVPLIRGGLHEASNLQLTHLRCNLSKGRKLVSEMRMSA